MDFSLWPACVRQHGFEDQLRAAQAGGFNCLPIGLLTYRQLEAQGMGAADIRALAGDYGIRLSHYDGFAGWLPEPFAAELPEAARQVLGASAAECLEICQALGLSAICATGVFDRERYDTEQLATRWADFSRRAGQLGIRAELEFIPMFSIPSLTMAWDIVRGSLADGASVFFDTWHFLRGEPDLDLLRQLPAGSIRTVQVADGHARLHGANLFEDCLQHRLIPGQGELPLVEILTILQAKGGVENIGPEIFSSRLDTLSAIEAADICASETRRVLDQSGWRLAG
ncbi:sugar phosphate isomerase/epimerase family protein [Halopseudomonas xiamenensis]|uniref:sugar phosphate isomerase/epimerase family protein n=1 Tax=Halopseudomonas xiamenensis TaxID=157792 RepID=UPI001625F0CE|nr:sugar phosphate isomerase/epimerase [Halopseudomonas xiamenensis]